MTLKVVLTFCYFVALCSCKPRKFPTSDLKDHPKVFETCGSPDPTSLIVSPYPNIPENVRLTGYPDPGTYERAKTLLKRTSPGSNIEQGTVIVADVYTEAPRKTLSLPDSNKTFKWLVIYENQSAHIIRYKMPGLDISGDFHIRQINVSDIYTEADGKVSLLAGDNHQEQFDINLEEIIKRSSSAFIEIRDFLKTREQEIAALSGPHQYLKGTFSKFLYQTDRSINHDAGAMNEFFETSVLKVKSNGYLKQSNRYVNDQKAAITGQSQCKQIVGDINCERALELIGLDAKTSQVFKQSLNATREIDLKFNRLALAANGRFAAFADNRGHIEILRWGIGKAQYKIVKTLRTQEEVVDLHFYNVDPNDVNGERLIVVTKSADGQFDHRIINMQFISGPITLGNHAANKQAKAIPFKSYDKSQFSLYKAQDVSYRQSFWDKAPADDYAGVYGVQFAHDCKSVFSAGSDGKIIRWDIRRLALPDGQKTIAAVNKYVFGGKDGAHKDRITSLQLARHFNYLLSSSMDGTAKLWNLNPSNKSYGGPTLEKPTDDLELHAVLPQPGLLGPLQVQAQQQQIPEQNIDGEIADEQINEGLRLNQSSTAENINDHAPTSDSLADEDTAPTSDPLVPDDDFRPGGSEPPVPIYVASFTANDDAVVISKADGSQEFFTIDGAVQYRGIYDEFKNTMLTAGAHISAFVRLPSKFSDVVKVRSLPDQDIIPTFLAYTTDHGRFYVNNVRDGNEQWIITERDPVTILDADLTVCGNYYVVARVDGEVRKRNNNLIDRKTDYRETDHHKWQLHLGPVYGVKTFGLLHTDPKDADGFVSVGFDGALKVSYLRNPEKDEPQYLNVMYADQRLSSLAVSQDSQYAVTGTIEGQVLLWWLGQELDLDQVN